ncbi:hypothetical protein OUZ56_025263 [Daphnia magna]|uniref:Uncharacterized protein n=1 Tax=Daphnia magna TaxID=35525 RepID=A0ABQ9ZJB2_9CRUS|nr:hypothetical protein OUZ56_025263 [Daphnia magna]
MTCEDVKDVREAQNLAVPISDTDLNIVVKTASNVITRVAVSGASVNCTQDLIPTALLKTLSKNLYENKSWTLINFRRDSKTSFELDEVSEKTQQRTKAIREFASG